MSYWKTYNKNLCGFTNQVLEFNKINKFNFHESGIYNHIRDLLAISIASFEDNEPIRILDFGSNTANWANLSNKINIENLDVTIFDPFCDNDYSVDFTFGFNVKVIGNQDLFIKQKFDLTIFGSSSQYIPNLFQDSLGLDCVLSKKILFTNTAFSTEESFIAKQNNSFKGNQFIRSYDSLSNIMISKNYKELFKSSIPISEGAYLHSENSSKIISLNILYSKLKRSL